MAAKRIEEQKNKKTEKLSKGVEKLVDEISKLSVMELSELVNALQDKLGVSPQVAPVGTPTGQAAAGPDASAGGEAQAGGGAATQTVVITASGDNKISVIKAIREINQNLGLKEAKDMTENLPAEILKDAKADDAKEASEKLKAAGATVELK
jgi:large subunit ribosomal protein L7/L12